MAWDGFTLRLPWSRQAVSICAAGLACLMAVATALLAACDPRPGGRLEIYPNHARLRVGEQIRYSVFLDHDGERSQVEGYSLVPEDPAVARVVGSWKVEALSAGKTAVRVVSDVGELALPIEVIPEARPPMPATHFSEVDRIVGEQLLFVGHSNLDGFDHTAVAKPGIDRLARRFRARGHPVIYWVSEEYPYWYTEDRAPDLAIVSEGQEHRALVDADRVVLSGGGFMFCVARNAQMTLHGMLRAARRERIHLVFPVDAIWAVDNFTPGLVRPYPALMALLARILSERPSEQERYEQVVVPFLDTLFGAYPVAGYPATVPEPSLEEVVAAWTVEVAIDGSFRRQCKKGDPHRVIVFDFLRTSAV